MSNNITTIRPSVRTQPERIKLMCKTFDQLESAVCKQTEIKRVRSTLQQLTGGGRGGGTYLNERPDHLSWWSHVAAAAATHKHRSNDTNQNCSWYKYTPDGRGGAFHLLIHWRLSLWCRRRAVMKNLYPDFCLMSFCIYCSVWISPPSTPLCFAVSPLTVEESGCNSFFCRFFYKTFFLQIVGGAFDRADRKAK